MTTADGVVVRSPAGLDDTAVGRRPALSLVVSTIGRRESFLRLLESIAAAQGVADLELVLVDQSRERESIAALEANAPAFGWTATTSTVGLSHGRNVGLEHARGEIVAFPDDDCWYEPDTITRALDRFTADPTVGLVSGRSLTADGRPSLLRWASGPRPVTRSNYHRTTISFTLFVRRALIDTVGPFAEDMGAGSSGWYGAGEESDLVLRLLAAGVAAVYDPAIVVHHDDVRDAVTDDFVQKMSRYGCGQGRVWREHRINRLHVGYLLARKVGGACSHYLGRQPVRARADLAFLRGCIAGLRDRPPRVAHPGVGLADRSGR